MKRIRQAPAAVFAVRRRQVRRRALDQKVLYIHFSSSTALDLRLQIALTLNLQPVHRRDDLVRQIADAVVPLNQSKKQHPILICDEAPLLPHPALEQLPVLLNVGTELARYLALPLVGQPLLRRTLSLQTHKALGQRIGTHYHLEGELSRFAVFRITEAH